MKSHHLQNFLIVIIIFSANTKTAAQNNQIRSIINSIKQQYAPDSRTAVFDISYRQTKHGIIVRGEVDNPEAKIAVINTLRKNVKDDVIDKIRVLPDSALGKNIHGIILIDAADVRRKSGIKEELLTQALMGAVVKILKKQDGYYYIQTSDKYLGWIETNSVYPTDQVGVDAWNTAHKVIVVALASVVREKPEITSVPICEASIGCILQSNGVENEWTSVELANGQKGFVQTKIVQDLDEWKKSRVLTGKNLEKTAKSFLSIPYLWGGVSVKGMDCSGFTKMVYRLNGLELNRDANQQVKQGTHIEPGENYKNLRKGDLLFFGRKASTTRKEHITHVAIYLEHKMFIHSSGKVRLGSFDPVSEFFEKTLQKKFVFARRII